MEFDPIFLVGFAAQILFSARLLVQWIKSEKAGRVLSPTLFWQLSLIGSMLLMAYGALRDDLVIILGQVFSYFIYIRNLQYKSAWKFIPSHFKALVIAFPIVAIGYFASDFQHSLSNIWKNNEVGYLLLVWGSLGQVIFILRFVYQWYVSEQQKRSVLPMGFWVISLTGSVMILSYAVFRQDPVLFLGQIFGFMIYARNIYIEIKGKKKAAVKKPIDHNVE